MILYTLVYMFRGEDLMEARKLLVVDNSPMFRKLCESIMQKDGWSVLQAQNGVDGMTVYRQNPGINAVLSGVHLEGGDGVEFCRAVRAYNPGASVYLISGGSEYSEEDFAAAGARGMLPKPCNVGTLQAAFRNLPERILLVDDGEQLGLIQCDLEDFGYAVDIADDVEPAKALFEPGKYGLVLSDVNMLDDGYDLCRYVKGVCPEQKFVLMTNLDIRPEEEALKAGAECLIKPKPRDCRDLVQRIEQVLHPVIL